MLLPRMIGMVLLVAGVALFIVGLNATDDFSERVGHFFSGSFSDETVWQMIGGIVLAAIGLTMVSLRGRSSSD